MRIAVVDYRIVRTNPAGSCHLAMLRGLCQEHEFTVFAVEFDNPCPERIRWLRVPAINRPLIALFVSFHFLASLLYCYMRFRDGVPFDCVQSVESNFAFGDVSYAHFCHRHYLRRHWRNNAPTGLRGLLRWLDHKAHAICEPWVFRRVRQLAVPSRGLAEELESEYPALKNKIRVIANPVELARFRRPDTFDRTTARAELGAQTGERILVFLALGHFERKGLPLLLSAMAEHKDIAEGHPLKLVVVGGESSLVAIYQEKCLRLGIGPQVTFTGMQADVRPYLWAADLFILPSAYEVFPLVVLQAAAAGLPLLVTQLNGVEEILRARENGFLMECSADGITQTLRVIRSLADHHLLSMGNAAQQDVQRYDSIHFVAAWRSFYPSLGSVQTTNGFETADPAPHRSAAHPK